MDKIVLRHVDVYITHTIKGITAESAQYGYVLAYHKKNGDLEILDDYNCIDERTTVNSVVLSAMKEALNRLTEELELNIYMDSQYIANMFETKTVEKWKNNGFLNSKGGKIVDFLKWERVLDLCEKHSVKVYYAQTHEWSMFIENELKKR